MTTCVIATAANDIHALVVACALEKIGVRCFRWVTSDFPVAQRIGISLGRSNRVVFHSADSEFELDLAAQDLVFWNRRVVTEHRVGDWLCESDRKVASREARAFAQGLVCLIDSVSFSVNRNEAARRAESKPLQLLTAKNSGWLTPDTLIGNDPSEITHFVKRSGVSLAKQFSPTVWKGSNGDLVTRSAVVASTMLPHDKILGACPMIFQDYIDKAFEVRITCFGERLVAVRLDSQKSEASKVDWRAISPSRLGVSRIELPKNISSSCIDLLRSLGLTFGCIDVIVTPNGDWVFLEINQMGQFLWIEEVNPDIPMLDLFVQLLLGSGSAPELECLLGLRHAEFVGAAGAILRAEQPLRVAKIATNVVFESAEDER